MEKPLLTLDDIKIRNDIRPGDLGYVIHRHGRMYAEENEFGLSFEMYVAKGIFEFYKNYNSEKERIWICEHNNKIIGFMLLMHRKNNVAQLRYFYLDKNYRGIGLGKKLMKLYMDFFHSCGYTSSYLKTMNEQKVAISLYIMHGFKLTEEVESTSFGRLIKEQRYDLSTESIKNN